MRRGTPWGYTPHGRTTTYSVADGLSETQIFVDEKPHHYAFAGDTVKLTGAEVMALAQGK